MTAGDSDNVSTAMEYSFVDVDADFSMVGRLPERVRRFILFDAGTSFSVGNIFDGFHQIERNMALSMWLTVPRPDDVWEEVLRVIVNQSRADHKAIFGGEYPGDIYRYRRSLGDVQPRKKGRDRAGEKRYNDWLRSLPRRYRAN